MKDILANLLQKTVRGLYDQNSLSIGHETKSEDSPVYCKYRGAAGKKCAIGHLISDEFYSTSFEGEDCSSTLILEAVCKSQNIEEILYDVYKLEVLKNFLRQLQMQLHDNFYIDQEDHFDSKHLLANALILAKNYDLKIVV